MEDVKASSSQDNARPSSTDLSLPAMRAALDGPDLDKLVDLLQRNLNLDIETATIKVLELVAGGTTGPAGSTAAAATTKDSKGKASTVLLINREQQEDLANQRKVAGAVVKLTMDNFVRWLLAFKNLISGIPEACDIILGVEHGDDFENGILATPKYNLALDKELGRVLISTVDLNVVSVLDDAHNNGERRGSVFFQLLRSDLLHDDAASQDSVMMTISSIKQGNHDITTLVKTFRYWFTHADLIGRPVSKSEQVRFFLASLHPRYASLGQSADLMRSQLKKLGLPYEMDFASLQAQALLEEQKWKKNQGQQSADHAFATAFQANGTPYKSSAPANSASSSHNSGKQNKKPFPKKHQPSQPRSFGHSHSKGPRVHTAPGVCSRCMQTGHWAKECRASWEECKGAQSKAGHSAVAFHAIESSLAQATRELQAIQAAQRQQ
ncbi:hypothetical protein A4X13_0g7435 [Tilletia indica]|uniref:Uncharacterized protein n=1 Tax=Tilletia indica TaxID=43049 RepID=A0A177TFR4_9BASI|nr:hypothetical protein A4X13_0g7435 [Tilletia indica]